MSKAGRDPVNDAIISNVKGDTLVFFLYIISTQSCRNKRGVEEEFEIIL